MKSFALLVTLAMLVPLQAQANPIALCMPGQVTQPAAGTVDISFDLDTGMVPNKVVIYRDKGTSIVDPKSATAVKVAELSKSQGTSSTADMGSGVSATLKFTVEETCVPVGTWSWGAFSDAGQDLYCLMSTDVTTTCSGNPTSTGTGTGGGGGSTAGGDTESISGCAFGPGRVAGTGAALGLALALLALARRRR